MNEFTREDKIQLLKSLAFYLAFYLPGADDAWGLQEIAFLDMLADIMTGNEDEPGAEKEVNNFYRRMCHCLLDVREE